MPLVLDLIGDGSGRTGGVATGRVDGRQAAAPRMTVARRVPLPRERPFPDPNPQQFVYPLPPPHHSVRDPRPFEDLA